MCEIATITCGYFHVDRYKTVNISQKRQFLKNAKVLHLSLSSGVFGLTGIFTTGDEIKKFDIQFKNRH